MALRITDSLPLDHELIYLSVLHPVMTLECANSQV